LNFKINHSIFACSPLKSNFCIFSPNPVSTDLENKNQWRRCFTVEGVQLPTGYYLGASALTGDLSDNHDVVSIKLYELESSTDGRERVHIVPQALSFEAPRERTEDSKKSSGWSNIKIFFSIMLTMLGVAAIVVGIMSYQKNQNARKRLY
jgi:lectin, mannose-binding 2